MTCCTKDPVQKPARVIFLQKPVPETGLLDDDAAGLERARDLHVDEQGRADGFRLLERNPVLACNPLGRQRKHLVHETDKGLVFHVRRAGMDPVREEVGGGKA